MYPSGYPWMGFILLFSLVPALFLFITKLQTSEALSTNSKNCDIIFIVLTFSERIKYIRIDIMNDLEENYYCYSVSFEFSGCVVKTIFKIWHYLNLRRHFHHKNWTFLWMKYNGWLHRGPIVKIDSNYYYLNINHKSFLWKSRSTERAFSLPNNGPHT